MDPSRSDTLAAVTAMAWGNPIVSTMARRMMPDTFSLRHNPFSPLYPHFVRSARQQFHRVGFFASSKFSRIGLYPSRLINGAGQIGKAHV